MDSKYDSYINMCNNLQLKNVLITKNEQTFKAMLLDLQCKNAKGFANNDDCKFEIRFN